MNFSYRGRLPEVKAQISNMAINGNGIRDTARVLKIGVAESVMIFKRLFTKELGFKFRICLYFIMKSATPVED